MNLKRDGNGIDFRTKRKEYESSVQKPEGGRTKLTRDADIMLPDDLQACVADQDLQECSKVLSKQKFN